MVKKKPHISAYSNYFRDCRKCENLRTWPLREHQSSGVLYLSLSPPFPFLSLLSFPPSSPSKVNNLSQKRAIDFRGSIYLSIYQPIYLFVHLSLSPPFPFLSLLSFPPSSPSKVNNLSQKRAIDFRGSIYLSINLSIYSSISLSLPLPVSLFTLFSPELSF